MIEIRIAGDGKFMGLSVPLLEFMYGMDKDSPI